MNAGPPRCVYCGDVIGVYEPLVVVDAHGNVAHTSLAADPDAIGLDGGFHRNCFEDLVSGPPPQQ
jgi:hypothetical protein